MMPKILDAETFSFKKMADPAVVSKNTTLAKIG